MLEQKSQGQRIRGELRQKNGYRIKGGTMPRHPVRGQTLDCQTKKKKKKNRQLKRNLGGRKKQRGGSIMPFSKRTNLKDGQVGGKGDAAWLDVDGETNKIASGRGSN